MEEFYKADCRKFPGNGAISITFSPVAEGGNVDYETELPIKGNTLLCFLKKLGLSLDGESPYLQYNDLEQEIQGQDETNFFATKKSIDGIINSFADYNDEESYDDGIIIIETVLLTDPIYLNEKIIDKSTKVRFYHKGRI